MDVKYILEYLNPETAEKSRVSGFDIYAINDKIRDLRKVGHLVTSTYKIVNGSAEEWYPVELTVFDCAKEFK